jgi:ferredoxin-NADP reductase
MSLGVSLTGSTNPNSRLARLLRRAVNVTSASQHSPRAASLYLRACDYGACEFESGAYCVTSRARALSLVRDYCESQSRLLDNEI